MLQRLQAGIKRYDRLIPPLGGSSINRRRHCALYLGGHCVGYHGHPLGEFESTCAAPQPDSGPDRAAFTGSNTVADVVAEPRTVCRGSIEPGTRAAPGCSDALGSDADAVANRQPNSIPP